VGAGGVQALLISFRVILPVFPLVNIRQAEFPILVRFVNAREEALALLVFRQVSIGSRFSRDASGPTWVLLDGVHIARDIPAIMAAANTAMMTSALLRCGTEHAELMMADLTPWTEEHQHEYESIPQMRGSMS
jgi:hypothetical protein